MKKIPVLEICAVGASIRRAGRRFSTTPEHFVGEFFNEDQAQAIDADRQLSVRMVEVDPAKVHVHGLEVKADPEAPTKPTEPEAPTVPTEPGEPTVPTEPEAPTVPTEPKEPAASTKTKPKPAAKKAAAKNKK